MSSTDDSRQPHKGWTEAGTISVWALDREGQVDQANSPILLAVEEWEKAGLRGIYVIDVWVPDSALSKAEDEPDLRHYREFWREEDSGSWQFAELVETGELYYVGTLPIRGRSQRQTAKSPPGHTRTSNT